MTADNVIDGELDTQGWNRFSYTKGNPIIYKDPTGHFGDLSTHIKNIIDFVQGNEGTVGGKVREYLSGTRNKENNDTNNKKQAIELQKAKGKSNSISSSELSKKRIKQSDPKININDKEMGKRGCYFRTIQSKAEEYVGKNLTADQINAAKKKLQSGKNPPVNKRMRVKNPEAVINDAFNRLGKTKVTGTVGWGGKKGQKPTSTIIRGKTKVGEHFKSADSKGNVIWDPGGNIQTTNDETIPVFIHDNEKK